MRKKKTNNKLHTTQKGNIYKAKNYTIHLTGQNNIVRIILVDFVSSEESASLSLLPSSQASKTPPFAQKAHLSLPLFYFGLSVIIFQSPSSHIKYLLQYSPSENYQSLENVSNSTKPKTPIPEHISL